MEIKNLEKAIRTRKSIRSYEKRPLTSEDMERIVACIDELTAEPSPFPADITVRVLETKKGANTERLGTYGVIKGADTFLGVKVKKSHLAMIAVGYTIEKLVLFAAEMGIGTCWIAGTFNRDAFTNALEVAEYEFFPIITPIGYPLDKSSLINSIMRKAISADTRKPFGELFFNNDLNTPLTETEAGEYAYPLNMLRLAPSAANRQPWRVVKTDNAFHFYKAGSSKENSAYEIKNLDVGIGACHFHLAAQEKGLDGHFEFCNPNISTPNDIQYLFSWVM
ncbi:MAG: nitroreductase family protein [Oscillospiraceae bacterium]|nr:nitroreductase family protein [Oscillospiraceae bacterium]